MKKVLFVASVKIHIISFHLPYLKWFKEQGYEVHVAANSIDDTDIPNCDVFHKINFDRFPFSTNNIKAYKDLKKIIRNNDFHIIHCHTPVASVLTRLAARTSKDTTVIYTAHGFHFYDGAPLLNWLIYYPVERFCAKFTDKLITINNEDYERAKKWSLRSNGKVYYVPGVGIDFNKFSNCEVDRFKKRMELGIDQNTKVMISVGELIKRKNHEVVIKSLAKIKYQNFVYLVVGQGELQKYLNNLIRKQGLQKKVKLLGFRTDVNELLKMADVFIFPSLQEGLPVALMEAMIIGLPVLCSNIRGNVDLFDFNGGILFKSNSIVDCKDAIEAIIKSDGKKMGEFNKSRLKDYSVDNILEYMQKIYI